MICFIFELEYQLFIPELLDNAFQHFDTKDIVCLKELNDGLNVLELWHGDTLAFKDLAMTCTVQFLNYFLKKRKKHFTAVVGKQ